MPFDSTAAYAEIHTDSGAVFYSQGGTTYTRDGVEFVASIPHYTMQDDTEELVLNH